MAYTTWEIPVPAHPVDSYKPPPCPCTTDPPWKVEICGQWILPDLHLTVLGNPLPVTCHQSRLNYKRRVYSAHMEGTPQDPTYIIGEAEPMDPLEHLLH